QGRFDADGLAFPKRFRGAEHLQLGLDVEPVAGFDLQCGDAAPDQRPQPRPRGFDQFLKAGRAGGLHRGGDAAARPRDLFIARAFQPLLEFAGTIAAEDEMGVAVDQARRNPGAVQRLDALRLEAGELGPPADADDPPVLDADCAIFDRAERARHGRIHGGEVAVDEQAVPHGSLSRASWGYGQSMSWTSIADLLAEMSSVPGALRGAPMEAGSVTPGRCDRAPGAVRKALRRISTYDLVEALKIEIGVHDAADVAVQGLMPADGF